MPDTCAALASAVRELSSLTGDDPLRALSPADHTDLASLNEWASQPAAIPQAPCLVGSPGPPPTMMLACSRPRTTTRRGWPSSPAPIPD